jgi:1-acyl-sn-glycerol-3-phosphate acyltransferase
MQEPLYRSVAGPVKVFIRMMGWEMLVTGEDQVPGSGPAVLASNHVSYLDPIIIGYGADRRGRALRFLAKKELFDRAVFGRLMRGLKQVPVDRYGKPGEAIRQAVAALQRGELVVNFPEATISTSFVPAEGKTGAVRMAMAAGVPLIPAALWGGQRILTKGRPRNIQRGVPLAVRFGEPLLCDPQESPVDVTKRLMERITELVDHAAATYPDHPAGPEDSWWLPAHLGGTAPSIQQATEMRRRQDEERRARHRRAQS